MPKTILLLARKPKKNKIIFITLLFLIIFLISSYSIKTYSTTKLIGVATCEKECYIEINLPSEKSDILNQDPILEYNNKKYKIKEIYIEDLFIENNVAFSKIKLKTELSLPKSNFVNFKLLYQKQRIIDKIIKNIKGKD